MCGSTGCTHTASASAPNSATDASASAGPNMMTAAMSSIIGWPVFGGARPGKPKKTVIRDAAGELIGMEEEVFEPEVKGSTFVRGWKALGNPFDTALSSDFFGSDTTLGDMIAPVVAAHYALGSQGLLSAPARTAWDWIQTHPAISASIAASAIIGSAVWDRWSSCGSESHDHQPAHSDAHVHKAGGGCCGGSEAETKATLQHAAGTDASHQHAHVHRSGGGCCGGGANKVKRPEATEATETERSDLIASVGTCTAKTAEQSPIYGGNKPLKSAESSDSEDGGVMVHAQPELEAIGNEDPEQVLKSQGSRTDLASAAKEDKTEEGPHYHPDYRSMAR